MTPNIQANKYSDKLPSKLTATNNIKTVLSEDNKIMYTKKENAQLWYNTIIENIKSDNDTEM